MNKNKIILILGFAAFVVMADNWVVSPILPSIAQNLNVEVSSASIIISAYMLPFGLFQLLFGYLAERFGKRQIITLSVILFTVSTGVCSLAAVLTQLIIFRALTGMFAAAVIPVSLALIGDLFAVEERQSAIGSFMGIAFLGQGLSMAIGGFIAYFLNWRGVFAIYAVLAVIASLLLITVGKKIPSEKNKNTKVLGPYIGILKNPSSVVIYLLVFFEGIFLIGSFSFTGAFIENTFEINDFEIGIVMTMFGIMAIISGRKAGKIVKKIGTDKVIMLGLGFAFITDLLFVVLSSYFIVIIIAVALMGTGFMLAHSTFINLATEFAAKARSYATSLVAFCFMGGGAIGTAVGGKIVAVGSYELLYILYGLGLLILTFSTIIIKRKINIF